MTSIKVNFVCSVVALTLVFMAGPGRADHSIEALGAQDAANGKIVYNGTCIACHAKNGKGAFPGAPNFGSKKGPLTKSDNELLHNIMEGFESPGSVMAMPPKGGNTDLTEKDVADVIAYIRKKFGS